MSRKKTQKKVDQKKVIIGILIFGLVIAATYISYVSLSNSNEKDLYSGYWDFEKDAVGSFPADWSGIQWGGTQVIEELDGQEKVVEIHDTKDNKHIEFAKYFEPLESGVIEFKIYIDSYKISTVHLCSEKALSKYDQDDDIVIRFGRNLNIGYWDEQMRWRSIRMFSKEHWYSIKIEFDANDDWHLWIDGISMDDGEGIDYYKTPKEFNNLYFCSYVTDKDYKIYIDDVKIEGVLLN